LGILDNSLIQYLVLQAKACPNILEGVEKVKNNDSGRLMPERRDNMKVLAG
jgi:hypothetical protein